MRCNPLRWLWGLIPVLMLSWVAVVAERGRIEADLTSRVRSALEQAGASWAGARFAARDGDLAGLAFDEADLPRAHEIARNVWGVRILDNKATLIDRAERYVWSASNRNGRLRLAGFVPNERARRDVLGFARARFPGLTIDDGMKLARGAPRELSSWLGGISFALQQLGQLKSGTAQLDGLSLTVEGEATSSASYQSVRSALSGGMPKGVRLGGDKVTAPLVKPFRWTASREGRRIALEGFVPSDRVREQLVAELRQIDRGLSLTDKLEIAEGAPNGWLGAASIALRQLTRLEKGTARLVDGQLQLEGHAEEEATAIAVGEVVRKGLPPGFRGREKIGFTKPIVPTVDPFSTSIALRRDGAVTVSGYVPSEAARAALLGAVRGRLGGNRRILDQTSIANGAGEGWQRCLEAGVGALARLGNGSTRAVGDRLVVVGETEDEVLAGALDGDLKQATARYCRAEASVRVLQPVEPTLSWRAEFDGKAVVLEGEVPRRATKLALMEVAKREFPNATLVDRTRVADTAPGRWPKVAEEALKSLAATRTGLAVIDGTLLMVRGEVPDSTALGSVRERLARDIPRGYRARDMLQIKSDAMIWAETEARRKAEEERQRAVAEAEAARRAEEERRRAEAEAARRAEEERRRAEAEAARRAEEERRRAEAEAARRAEQERRRAEAEAARRAEDERRRAEAEAARRAEEERRRAEAEAARRAEQERRRAEAETERRRRLLEEERARAEAEAARRAEEERRRAEAEARRRSEEAEAQRRAELERQRAVQAEERRRAAEAEARQRAEEERRRAAAEAARVQEERRRTLQARADRCQEQLRSAAASGIIRFRRASAELEGESTETLDRLVGIVRACPGFAVEIEGHTDSEGTDQRNQRLSERRAQSVVDYLTRSGIEAGRLVAIGYGSTRPIAPNDNAEGRARNRRIEFVVKPQ
jgi:OOP family OmpA-OmpF porin